MTVSGFWHLSLMEIYDTVAAYNQKVEREFKQKVKQNFLLAEIIVADLGLSLDKKPALQPWDYYPSMFQAERDQHEKLRQMEEMEQYKERRRQYAGALNAQRRG